MGTSVVRTKPLKRRRAKQPRKPEPVWVKGCAICGGGAHEYGRCPACRR